MQTKDGWRAYMPDIGSEGLQDSGRMGWPTEGQGHTQNGGDHWRMGKHTDNYARRDVEKTKESLFQNPRETQPELDEVSTNEKEENRAQPKPAHRAPKMTGAHRQTL